MTLELFVCVGARPRHAVVSLVDVATSAIVAPALTLATLLSPCEV